MAERVELSAERTAAAIRAVAKARDGAAHGALILAQAGLGETGLWQRLDALESEMKALLAGFKPTLFLE